MSEDPETGERRVSDSLNVGEELVYAVQEAVDDWVAAEDIPIRRIEDQIIADEDELVKNICVMTVLAVDEASE